MTGGTKGIGRAIVEVRDSSLCPHVTDYTAQTWCSNLDAQRLYHVLSPLLMLSHCRSLLPWEPR